MPVTPFEDPTYLEAVYQALFALLGQATFPSGLTFKSMKRLADPPDDVPVSDQPALRVIPGPLLAEHGSAQNALLGPTKWLFSALVVIYLRADASANPNPLPTTAANYFVWGIARVLDTTFPPYEKQTLGGLVYHVWIEGNVHTEVVNEQITIAIPVLILPGPYGV
jgi:hypothetical protein